MRRMGKKWNKNTRKRKREYKRWSKSLAGSNVLIKYLTPTKTNTHSQSVVQWRNARMHTRKHLYAVRNTEWRRPHTHAYMLHLIYHICLLIGIRSNFF